MSRIARSSTSVPDSLLTSIDMAGVVIHFPCLVGPRAVTGPPVARGSGAPAAPCGRGPAGRRAAGSLAGPAAVGRAVALVVLLVRVDDTADQPVPDDIVRGEPGEVDVVDALEDLLDLAQTALGVAGQVDLGDVA